MVDKTYCASSYLMYRTVVDKEKCFSEKLPINRFTLDFPRTPVYTAKDLSISLEKQIKEWTADGKTALALSDGIDSAILAKFMPGGVQYIPSSVWFLVLRLQTKFHRHQSMLSYVI